MTDSNEKRRFKRFLFSKTEKPTAILDLPKYAAEGIRADILNLSEGGVGLRFSDRESSFVYAGDHVVCAEDAYGPGPSCRGGSHRDRYHALFAA